MEFGLIFLLVLVIGVLLYLVGHLSMGKMFIVRFDGERAPAPTMIDAMADAIEAARNADPDTGYRIIVSPYLGIAVLKTSYGRFEVVEQRFPAQKDMRSTLNELANKYEVPMKEIRTWVQTPSGPRIILGWR